MKKIIGKLFAVALIVIAGGSVFAQTSNTNASTQALYGNDVDSFMDVNGWSDVQPDNLFGYLGYGTGSWGGGAFEVGLAHQFAPFYLGAYFSGALPGYQSTTDKKENDNPVFKHKTVTSNSTDTNSFSAAALLGIGDIGIKYEFSYKPTGAGNSSLKDTQSDNETTVINKNKSENFNMSNVLSVGFNIDTEKFYLTPFASVGLNTNRAYSKSSTSSPIGNTESYTNASTNLLSINLGSGISIPENGILKNDLKVSLGMGFTIFPSVTQYDFDSTSNTPESTVVAEGRTNNFLSLTPEYVLTVTPADNFSMKIGAGLPIVLKSWNGAKKATAADGSLQPQDYIKTTGFSITPALSLAAQYDVTENLVFNAGLSFNVPSLVWTTTNNIAVDSTGVDKSTRYDFYSANMNVAWSSGFCWTIADMATVDVFWNILGNIFNNFTTNFTETDSISILNTLNKLFVHNLGIMLSMKF